MLIFFFFLVEHYTTIIKDVKGTVSIQHPIRKFFNKHFEAGKETELILITIYLMDRLADREEPKDRHNEIEK